MIIINFMYKKEVQMVKIIRLTCGIFVFTLAVSLVLSATWFAQEKKVDTQKLYEEIAGYYEFEAPEQTLYITFWVEDGVLKAKQEDDPDDEIVTLEPIEGKELAFEVTTQGGQVIELKFSRDEEGKITKCVVIAMGIKIEGVKIKK